MSAIVEIRELSKTFARHLAVDHLNLAIENGEVFGLVGPNGAGKTTTMRMVVTLLEPDQGDILVGGHSVSESPDEVRRLIGFMPDSFGVYDNMSVLEYLDFFGACYRILPAQRAKLIEDLLELVDIGHRRDDMVDTLSRGLKQRLGLARVLLHDPQVLVLDEPASGLDPRARVEIRELLLEVARLGKTIIFSSHILADVAEICTRIGIVEEGRLVALGELDQLSAQLAPHRLLRIVLLNKISKEDAQTKLASLAGISAVHFQDGKENGGRISLEVEFIGDDDAMHALLAQMLTLGFPVVHFSEDTQNLEKVFMRATRGIVS
jgi:ABC-2 type transport system ATP-binding protein